MKKILLALFATIAFAVPAMAVDGTANITAQYISPITITEQTPWSFTIQRKTAMGIPPSALYVSDAGWAVRYNDNPYNTQVAGCFSSTGDATRTASITFTPPAKLNGTGFDLDLTNSGTGKWVGAVDATGTNCATASGGTYNTGNIDGSVVHTYPAGGSLYVSYKMATQTIMQVHTANQMFYTGTANVIINYL